MEGFQFVDIILLAMVAGFLILRLRSALGRRTGHEQRQSTPLEKKDNVVNIPSQAQADADLPTTRDIDPAYLGTRFEEGLAQITLYDSEFTVAGFLAGAAKAFEMTVLAYAQHDTDSLRPLLADDVYSNFASAIQDREDQGERIETELVEIKPPSLEEISVKTQVATVAVRFDSEQINVVKDSNGEVLDGDPEQIENVTDVWTFQRNLASHDPNWKLVATRSEN